MSGKAIAVGVLLLGIGGLAVANWWNYLKAEGPAPRRTVAAMPSAPSAAAATAPAKAATSQAGAASGSAPAVAAATDVREPEPPKRRPKSGEEWNDPFEVEAADVVIRPPPGMKRGPKAPKPAYVVDLILIDGSRRRASVNGALRSAGDWIGAVELVRIERDGVLLRNREGRELFVKLAELNTRKS